MPVLITGLGYIGARLAELLLERGERVVGLENFFATDEPAVERLAERPGFRLVRGSVADPAAVGAALVADAPMVTVYHLAAQASAHPLAAPPAYTEETNLAGPRVLAEAATAHRVRRIVFASSFRVYGDDLRGVVSEDRPYGVQADLSHLSKLYAEKLFELTAHRGGPSVAAVRLGLVYGLGPVMKRDPRFMTAPNRFCLQAACGEVIEVHHRRRTGLIHLDDAVRALILAAEARDPRPFVAYNAVSEVAGIGEVASLVAELAGRRGLRVEIAGPTLPTGSLQVTSRLAELGFRPRRTLRDGLAEVLDYWLRQPAGVRG